MVRTKYGARFAPLLDPDTRRPICPIPDWKIEAKMYLMSEKHHPPGWLGKAAHFKKMISIIWASPIAKRPFQWNPNACRIVEEYFKNTYLGIAGHASSSKSETCAVIALAEFIADPENTAVLVTSTTIPEARGRIWGRVEVNWQDCIEYFNALGQSMGFNGLEPPGELVSSSAIIRYKLGSRKDDTRGIKLVPGKESEVKEGIGRLKGFKAKRLRFLADELSDLSHKLLDAAESNLFVNEDFKMIGCYNPASHFDPAGVFSEPEKGWGSVDVSSSDGWKTRRGYCIRFDGQNSPNVVAGVKNWEGLLTREKLDEARKNLGDNSPRFLEQYRAAWSSTGHADCIYSEAEIIKYLGMSKVDVWMGPKTKAAGFDPSFVHDGDRAALTIGNCGDAVCFESRRKCAEADKVIYLDDNIDTKQDKKEFIIKRLKEECIRHNVDPVNLAMDATGGGDVFATLMSRDPFFGNKFMKVQFGGSGSEMLIGGRKGKDRYANMASELWYSGKPLLRMGQIKGLTPELVREMTLRLYQEGSGGKKQIKIEPKGDMKSRLNGRSPDAADSYFLFIHACRVKLGLHSEERVAKVKKQPVLEDPMAGAFSWGKPKKPSLNEPQFVSSSAGWADEDSGGGVFGGF